MLNNIMAKKKKIEKEARQTDVTFRDGKWVTSDGLCFNTADKAWRHIAETAPPKENDIETSIKNETSWEN